VDRDAVEEYDLTFKDIRRVTNELIEMSGSRKLFFIMTKTAENILLKQVYRTKKIKTVLGHECKVVDDIVYSCLSFEPKQRDTYFTVFSDEEYFRKCLEYLDSVRVLFNAADSKEDILSHDELQEIFKDGKHIVIRIRK
jgi:hypothetical protein